MLSPLVERRAGSETLSYCELASINYIFQMSTGSKVKENVSMKLS